MMSVSKNMELRQLNVEHKEKLKEILDRNENWVKLMEIIPKNSGDGRNKYSTEDIRKLGDLMKMQNMSPTEIIIEEWGTSGRKRPTVNDLLILLTQVEIYRAADYIAIKIFGENPPERPTIGPAKKVSIELPPCKVDRSHMEKILEKLNDPNTASLENHRESHLQDMNKDSPNKINLDKKIGNPVFTETSMEISSNGGSQLDNDSQSIDSQRLDAMVRTDLIEFSVSQRTNNLIVDERIDENSGAIEPQLHQPQPQPQPQPSQHSNSVFPLASNKSDSSNLTNGGQIDYEPLVNGIISHNHSEPNDTSVSDNTQSTNQTLPDFQNLRSGDHDSDIGLMKSNLSEISSAVSNSFNDTSSLQDPPIDSESRIQSDRSEFRPNISLLLIGSPAEGQENGENQ